MSSAVHPHPNDWREEAYKRTMVPRRKTVKWTPVAQWPGYLHRVFAGEDIVAERALIEAANFVLDMKEDERSHQTVDGMKNAEAEERVYIALAEGFKGPTALCRAVALLREERLQYRRASEKTWHLEKLESALSKLGEAPRK